MTRRRHWTFATLGATAALIVTAGTFAGDYAAGVSIADMAIDALVIGAVGAGLGLAIEQISFWLRPRRG